MSPATSAPRPVEGLHALRRLIGELAPPCGLDLADRVAVRRFLDDEPPSRSERTDPQSAAELRRMLILLFRLEASSSEDLGIEGLRRLWSQHGEIMARFTASHPG
jgi:hypothetical protein